MSDEELNELLADGEHRLRAIVEDVARVGRLEAALAESRASLAFVRKNLALMIGMYDALITEHEALLKKRSVRDDEVDYQMFPYRGGK